ncbi:Sulfotransferase domain [Dillenia turbinata]|uniref:Sulfotransferase n=1 Tax=Dillenia turbinata TaxID=194707 RepID=A0AAN8VV79_9MAGN
MASSACDVHKTSEPQNGEEGKVKFEDKLKTLDKGDFWTPPVNLYRYEGFWFFPDFLEGIMLAQEQFKSHPNDIILCTAPKAGTTWIKALAFAILSRHGYDFSSNPLLTTISHECVRYIEVDYIRNWTKRDPEIPLLATHMPYTSLPKSVMDSGCKIVYVGRDPKAVLVSLWHFLLKLGRKDKVQFPIEKAHELFCEGVSSYGPYWDHALGYWKASLERPNNVLFFKYEDMKRDPCSHVKRLAEFLGTPFSGEEEADAAVEKVIKLCSFETLSKLEVNKTGHIDSPSMPLANNLFFREGESKDWVNHLSKEMAERIDRISVEKFKDFGLSFDVPTEQE